MTFEEKDFNDSGINLTVWKKTLKLFKPFIKYIIILIVLNSLIALGDILFPLFNQYLIDNFNVFTSNTIIKFGLLYGGLILLMTACHYIYFFFAAKIESNFNNSLKIAIYKKLQKLSHSFYDQTPTGWIITRINSDCGRIAENFAWSFAELFYGFPLMIIATIVMFTYSIKLTLIVLIFVPISAYIMLHFYNKILKKSRNVRKLNSYVNNEFAEGINGAKSSKTLGIEEINNKNFRNSVNKFYKESMSLGRSNAIHRPTIEFITSLATCLLIYFGGIDTTNNIITIGTLSLFIQYSFTFFDPIIQLAFISQDIQVSQASAERVIYVLEAEETITDTKQVINKYGTILNPKEENYLKLEGNVEFKDVDFYYKKENPVLTNFNLKVSKGQSIALVGETGSGKSTIVNLLCRFYEPINGHIYLDGIDYKDISLGNITSSLGYVLQTPTLFNGSIADNVRFGKLDASDEEVIEALKLVNAYDFVSKLPNGINQDVGEEGNSISYGQRQLLCLARAIVSKPAIFILDEATASIDTESEKLIQDAIDKVLKNKTSFIVAHRLSTIRNVDRILYIEKGKIIEDGNHEQLMNLNGKYHDLYLNQFNEEKDIIA